MNKSREQFEQKFQRDYGEEYLRTDDDGDYVHWLTADLWEFWQASRASIEIELPMPTYSRMDLQAATMHRVGLCKDVLRAVGLKIKGE